MNVICAIAAAAAVAVVVISMFTAAGRIHTLNGTPSARTSESGRAIVGNGFARLARTRAGSADPRKGEQSPVNLSGFT